jgi:hypothetical protein
MRRPPAALRPLLVIAMLGASCGGAASPAAPTGATPGASGRPTGPTSAVIGPSVSGPSGPQGPSSPEAPAEVPEILRFETPLVGGGELRGAELAGAPVALWFWAPW